MAERTVNVRINYQVNTADIQRAERASAAAQKATDNLRRASVDYGKAAAQAHKQNSDGAAKASKDVSLLAKDFNSLYTSVKLFLTAGIAREVLNITLGMATLSGTMDGVTRAFGRIPNATLLLNELKKATHGTVTDLALMQRALSAQNFRIPLEKLGKLLEFAAVKAQQTGQEVNHLVDYIVSGIGYRSIKRLDDLGFTANRIKEALGGVSLQAASMGEVMDAVTKLMDEDLAKTGGFAVTAETKVKRLERAWHDLKVEVSSFFTSPKILDFYNFVLEHFTKGVQTLAGTFEKNEAKQAAIKDVENFKERALTKEILQDKVKILETVKKELDVRNSQIVRNREEIKDIDAIHARYKNLHGLHVANGRMESEGLGEQRRFYKFKNEMLYQSIDILKEYLKTLDEVVEKSEEDAESRLVTDPVAFLYPGKKKSYVDKSLARAKDSLTSREPVEGFIMDVAAQIQEAANNIPPIKLPVEPAAVPYQDTAWEQIADDFRENWREVLALGVDDTASFIIATEEAEINSLQRRLAAIRNYYDEQQLLAGDNERAKDRLRLEEERRTTELQRKIAEKEWKIRRSAILVDIAAGIAKNFALYGWPGAVYPSIITAGEGAVQLAIADQNRPRFAKGVINLQGKGTETSDSIDAKLSKGESVITAEATRRSMGLLKAIQVNKIDDRILKNIDFSGGRVVLNDERIVRAIQSQEFPKPPDVIKQGRQLLEVWTDKNKNKRYIRSKHV